MDKEGLVREENQQNSLERKIRSWWWLSTLSCGVMGDSQKYTQSNSEGLVLTEHMYHFTVSATLL